LEKIPFVEVSKVISNLRDSSGNFLPAYHYKDFRDAKLVIKSVQDIANNIYGYTFENYLERKNVDLKRRAMKGQDFRMRSDSTKQLLQYFSASLTYRIFNTYKTKYNVLKLSRNPAPIMPVPTVPIDRIIRTMVPKKSTED